MKPVSWSFFVLAVLATPSMGLGGAVYTYTGALFDELIGDYFKWGDFVSGYVRFDTEPTTNSVFGAANVAAFEFSAGEVTLSSADSSILNPQHTVFVFDAAGKQIHDWRFEVGQYWGESIGTNVPDGARGRSDYVVAFARMSGAIGPSGRWSVVPEPATGGLWLLAGMAAAVYGWRRRTAVSAVRPAVVRPRASLRRVRWGRLPTWLGGCPDTTPG